MTPRRDGSFTAILVVGALLAATLGSACTRPLLERAITARGGALTSLSRDAEADVHAGFPGRWRWRLEYAVPDRLRWTIETYGEEQSVSFDGSTVRYFLGSAPIPAAPAALGDFRTVVRWTAVTTLDALRDDPQVEVRELPRAGLPAGTASALEVTYRADGARYLLWFDAADLLVAAEGPIALPTIASGRMRATYTQFATTGGYVLPARGTYTLDDRPFFDERVLRWTPNDARLVPASFQRPPARAAR